MRSVIKSIRFSEDVLTAVEREAEKLGLRSSDVVMHALYKYLGMPTDPSVDLMIALKRLVERNWDRQNFPQDVTLQLFRQIKSDRALRSRYQRVIANGEGEVDEHMRAQINRRIGKMVKQVLRARVVGRSLPLNRKEELIETHALLEPGSQQS